MQRKSEEPYAFNVPLPCTYSYQITALLKVKYLLYISDEYQQSEQLCTLSNHNNLVNTIVYYSSVTTDDFSLNTSEIGKSIDTPI